MTSDSPWYPGKPAKPQEEQDMSAFVQSTVQAAVQAAGQLPSDDETDEALPPRHSASHTATQPGATGDPTQPPSLHSTPSKSKLPKPASRSPSQSGAGGRSPEPARASASGDGADASSGQGPSVAQQLDVPGQPQTSLRLHKAQIRALEKDLQAAQRAIEVKGTDAKEAREELRTLKADRANASRSTKGLEGQVLRLQKQVDELKGQLAARDTALRQASEVASSAGRGSKATESELAARSARLNRALEEVQRYRKLLEDAKVREQSQQSVAQSEHNQVVANNKKLERQKADLLAAFKRQIKLIDVLKRQKVHIEAARLLQFTEDEFIAALEQPSIAF